MNTTDLHNKFIQDVEEVNLYDDDVSIFMQPNEDIEDTEGFSFVQQNYYPKFQMLVSLDNGLLHSKCNFSVYNLLCSMTTKELSFKHLGFVEFKKRGYTLVDMCKYICSKNLYTINDELLNEDGSFIKFPKTIDRQTLQNEICKLAYFKFIVLCERIKREDGSYEEVEMNTIETKNTKGEVVYKLDDNKRFSNVTEMYINKNNQAGVLIDAVTYRELSKVLRPDALKVYLFLLARNRYFKSSQPIWKINAVTIFKGVFGEKEKYSRYDIKKVYDIMEGLSTIDLLSKDVDVTRADGQWSGIYVIKNVKEPNVSKETEHIIENSISNRGRKAKGA